MAICVNVERMYAVVFPLKTVGWRRYMLPVCLTVATLYNIPKVQYGSVKAQLDKNPTRQILIILF